MNQCRVQRVNKLFSPVAPAIAPKLRETTVFTQELSLLLVQALSHLDSFTRKTSSQLVALLLQLIVSEAPFHLVL